MTADFAGETICDTDRALRVLETHHAPTYYLPVDALPDGLLVSVPGRSICEWKGAAAYYDLVSGDTRAVRAAWGYPSPVSDFAALKDHVAIYPAALDAATVDGLPVTPQPGDFYGGWVTPNLDGTVKGGPGTEGW